MWTDSLNRSSRRESALILSEGNSEPTDCPDRRVEYKSFQSANSAVGPPSFHDKGMGRGLGRGDALPTLNKHLVTRKGTPLPSPLPARSSWGEGIAAVS